MKKGLMIFIVDDDPIYVKMLELYLMKEVPDLTIRTFSTGEACLHEMHLDPDVIILDYFLNSEFPEAWDGIRILKKLSWNHPYTTTIMLSSQQNIETAMDTINEGAYEYVIKNDKAFLKIKSIITNLSELIDEKSDE